MLTYEQWQIERTRLEAAQADIQTAIDNIEGSYSGGGVAWSRTGKTLIRFRKHHNKER